MKVLAASALCSLALFCREAFAMDDVVLSNNIMKLTNFSAYLSALAYEEDPPATEDMEYLHFYDEEPDQGLVVKAFGYCFGVFRGTTLTWDDW